MTSNVHVIERVYESFARGAIADVLGAFDEQIDWQEPASLPFDNQIGPTAVAENIFAPLGEQVQNFSVNPRELHDAGDVVFATGTYRGRGTATGKDFEADFVHVWRMKDGKVAGFRTYTDTHVYLQALGLA